MTTQETLRTAKHELLDFVQHKLVRLGCLRFQTNDPPQPNANDVIAWAIGLYEQSSDLHRQVFDHPASTANELRMSRQALNFELTALIVLAMTLREYA